MLILCDESDNKCEAYPISVPIYTEKVLIHDLSLKETKFLEQVIQEWENYSYCHQKDYGSWAAGQYDSWWVFEAVFNSGKTIQYGPSGDHQRVKHILDYWSKNNGPPKLIKSTF